MKDHAFFTSVYEKVLNKKKKKNGYNKDLFFLFFSRWKKRMTILTFLKVLGRSKLFGPDDQFCYDEKKK